MPKIEDDPKIFPEIEFFQVPVQIEILEEISKSIQIVFIFKFNYFKNNFLFYNINFLFRNNQLMICAKKRLKICFVKLF